MKRKWKRIAALAMTVLLTGNICMGFYFDSYATGMEVVGAGQAFSYLLGLFGVVMADQAAYESGAALEVKGAQALSEYEEWVCEQQEGWTIENSPVGQWINDLQSGIVDTSSDVYSHLKTWIGTLRTNQSGGIVTPLASNIALASDSGVISYFNLRLVCTSDVYVFCYYAGENDGICYCLMASEPFTYKYFSTYYNKEYNKSSFSRGITIDGVRREYFYSGLYMSDRGGLSSGLFGLSVGELPVCTTPSPVDLLEEYVPAYVLAPDIPEEKETPYVHVPGLPEDVWERDKSYDNVEVSGAIDWDKVGFVPNWLEKLLEGLANPSDLADAAGVTVTDKAADVPDEEERDIPWYLQRILDWIMDINGELLKMPLHLANAISDVIESVFIPPDGYFDDKIYYIQDKMNEAFNVSSFDMSFLFADETPIKDVTITINGVTSVILESEYLVKAVNFFRSVIRGFICLLLVFYNINQFLTLIGQAPSAFGVFNKDTWGGKNE